MGNGKKPELPVFCGFGGNGSSSDQFLPGRNEKFILCLLWKKPLSGKDHLEAEVIHMEEKRITRKRLLDYTRYLHQAERSPGTIENYLRHAEAFACWLDHRPVTKELASR